MKLPRTFTQSEEKILQTIDEPFRTRFICIAKDVIAALADDTEIEVLINDGFRPTLVQDQLYKIGRRRNDETGKWERIPDAKTVTNAPPGSSAHEYRRACHIVLLKDKKWLDSDDKRWKIIGEKAKKYRGNAKLPGVLWGGEFKRLYDPAHIEDFHFRVVKDRLKSIGIGSQRFDGEELCPGYKK